MLQLPIPNVVAKTQLLSLVQQVCTLWLLFLAIFHNCHHSSSPQLALSCMKILLTLRMWPAAIALNHSIKNIRNNVRQIILQQKSLVWGSLTLAPITVNKNVSLNLIQPYYQHILHMIDNYFSFASTKLGKVDGYICLSVCHSASQQKTRQNHSTGDLETNIIMWYIFSYNVNPCIMCSYLFGNSRKHVVLFRALSAIS